MSTEPNFQCAYELLTNPLFSELADESVRRYISWDELTDRPLPPGLSAKQTWTLLSQIRRAGAIVFPIPSLAGEHFWYHITEEGHAALKTIGRHCRPESVLHRTIVGREGHQFLLRSRLQESIASCALDGIYLDRSSAGAVVGGRGPRTPEERLVTNSYEMLMELDSLATERFTPELIRYIYDRISKDVPLDRLKRGTSRTDLGDDRNPRETPLTPGIKARVLQELCDVANGEMGNQAVPVPTLAYNILTSMAYWQPMPDLNHTVSVYMQRLFAVQRNFPVLGYLPTSSLVLKWFRGELSPGLVRFTKIQRIPLPDWIDGTEDILTYLQLIVAAISELNDFVSVAQEEDAALDTALESVDLNYRQRALIRRALEDPSVEFEIRQQQTIHRVAYATARADLLKLVDLGYLAKQISGQTLVFSPVTDLESRVRKAAGGV
ncbi:MAG: Fic family protein [Coriobacteriia bacterium]